MERVSLAVSRLSALSSPCQRKHAFALLLSLRDVAHAQRLRHLGDGVGLGGGGLVAQADAVDAMPLVGGRREALVLENMPQVALALGANDLDARAVRVGSLLDGAVDAIVERRPSTAAVELGSRVVERSAAADARVRALLRVFRLVLLFEAILKLSLDAFRVAGRLAAKATDARVGRTMVSCTGTVRSVRRVGEKRASCKRLSRCSLTQNRELVGGEDRSPAFGRVGQRVHRHHIVAHDRRRSGQ